jgi:polyisoprenyl-phosphate glycosyltransferase
MPPALSPELSIVVPVYNEEDVLPLLVQRLRPVADGLGTGYEVVAVDDGSTDATAVVLQRIRREWPELRVVRLRANAGHQAAISAGLSVARGDYVVTLDADLQDPPEVIPEMLAAAREHGVDVVYGVRSDRSTDSAFKRVSARAFYRVIRLLSGTHAQTDAGDYRMMSRATVDAVNALPEHNRVLRFIVPALGFPSASVSYRRDERAAGRSKYPLAKMLRLSIDSVTGFSIAPLRAATWLGLTGGLAAVGLLVYALVAQLVGHTLPGWTSTVVAVAGVGAVQLLCLGILGEYVGRMYAMMQARPTYFIAYDSLTGPTTTADAPLPAESHQASL